MALRNDVFEAVNNSVRERDELAYHYFQCPMTKLNFDKVCSVVLRRTVVVAD